MTSLRAWALGSLTVGVLDGLDAVIFFGLRGVRPIRIFQAIASGLLGKSAFAGGLSTALLGVGCHFLIATGIVGIYLLASRSFTVLARRPWVCGPLYGLVVYGMMNYVVVPLSLAANNPKPTAVLVNGLLIHLLGVGLPAALFARAARRVPA
ncbi:MAG: hypothetical protein FD129_681 [bacterium]|nr:MAG: hypothetical protein FD129_681 [bacterium]